MNKYILLLVSFFAVGELLACINGESKILSDGTFLYEDHDGRVPRGHTFDFAGFPEGIYRLDSLYKATKEIEYLSDKGVLLILTKEYQAAIQLYLEIEKSHPDRYSTASNMGTAYELIGDNENALKWIEKSVTLNPESHFGSEWIHVNILKAKISGDSLINSEFLLHTSFGNDILPHSELSKAELEKLYQSLYFQLNERMSFVEPEDKIVAQLLFDLGNIEFLLKHKTEAKKNYQRALEYGYTEGNIQEKIAAITEMDMKISEIKQHIDFSPVIIGVVVFLLIGILILFIRRKKKSFNSI